MHIRHTPGLLGLLLLVSPFLPTASNAQDYNAAIQQLEVEMQDQQRQLESLKLDWIREELEKQGLPRVRKGTKIVWYDGFGLQYSPKYKQARWVAHMILPDIEAVCEPRTEDFLEDPEVDSKLTLDLYVQEKKEYDRGHLAPAADLRWSPRAVEASFYLTNMSPQRSDLNRNLWRELEVLLRQYVTYYDNGPIMVVSGPVLKGSLPKLKHKREAKEQITIPKTYFKVAIDLKRKRGIGFVMDQDAPSPTRAADIRKELLRCVRSIDEVEKRTGLNFFADMNDQLERPIEKQETPHFWMAYAPMSLFKLPEVKSPDEAVLTSAQAKERVRSFKKDETQEVQVIGRVVSASRKNGKININLDATYPENSCFVQVDENDLKNFRGNPETELRGEVVTFTGQLEKSGFGRSLRACVVIDEASDLVIRQ